MCACVYVCMCAVLGMCKYAYVCKGKHYAKAIQATLQVVAQVLGAMHAGGCASPGIARSLGNGRALLQAQQGMVQVERVWPPSCGVP